MTSDKAQSTFFVIGSTFKFVIQRALLEGILWWNLELLTPIKNYYVHFSTSFQEGNACTCKYKSSAADLLFVRNYPAEILKQTRYASPVFISDSNHFYRQPMKLREGNVFSRVYQPVCLSLHREGPRDCEPVQTCSFGNPPPCPGLAPKTYESGWLAFDSTAF